MKWLAITPDNKRTLVIACEGVVTWAEVRAYARRTIGADLVTPTEETAREDVTLQWAGTDAGSPPTRRMQERKRGAKEWRDIS